MNNGNGETMDEETIGARIIRARAASGHSQAELAVALDVAPATLGRWERGETEVGSSTLGRIAEVCGVDVAWLLDGRGRAPRSAK